MTKHEHGGRAGAELWVSGARSANLYSREVPMDVKSMPNAVGHPFQTHRTGRYCRPFRYA